MTHELVHVEIRAGIGSWKSFWGALPAMMEEGLAEIISRDKRYVKFMSSGKLACQNDYEGLLKWQIGLAYAACQVMRIDEASAEYQRMYKIINKKYPL